MGNMFGKEIPLKELLKQNKRQISRAIRELDREVRARTSPRRAAAPLFRSGARAPSLEPPPHRGGCASRERTGGARGHKSSLASSAARPPTVILSVVAVVTADMMHGDGMD